MTTQRLTPALLLAAFALLALPTEAHAGGFYISDRGVRPAGRGFAFVAGADDPQALWYNPAGLGFSGQQLLIDANLLFFRGSYTRVDSGGNTLPTVEAEVPLLPLPMLAYSDNFGLERWTFGAGLFVPTAVLGEYPSGLDGQGHPCDMDDDPNCGPAPQRYSLINLNGSALAHLALSVAYRPIDELSIGLGVQMMVGVFQAVVAMTACDRFLCTQPENPEWDGYARLSINPVIEPGLQGGVIYRNDVLSLGFSFLWWPKAIRGDATIDVRLPSAVLFEGARVEGNKARVTLPFPLTLRAGVEVRPTPYLRLEVAGVFERWSSQSQVTVDPRDVWIRDALAIGDYEVGSLSIPRNMRDTYSVRVGGELTLPFEQRLSVRGGLMFETSSFSDSHLTVLTLDTRKYILGLGASFEVKPGIFLDVSYAHLFLQNRNVTNSQVTQPNPIRPPAAGDMAPDGPAYIGNGRYAMEGDMLGIGLRWQPNTAPPVVTPEPMSERGEGDAPTGRDSGEREAPAEDASPTATPDAPQGPDAGQPSWSTGYAR
ncbi:MAG: outer membrane protein transport protein [Sandaracinaceae bacterium]|nr:outer membrane protein transport protein [Myxococcales bacterium]MCB9658100.1 outer membrane protein transport protein [Sandaracinaceae bacterium]